MSELPISSPYRSTPDAPVTEQERNQVSSRLNAAFTAGAIDADDYHARLDRLFAAQRLGELVEVVDKLPPLPTHENPAIVAPSTGRPGELAETRGGGQLTLVTVGALVGVVVLIAILLVILL